MSDPTAISAASNDPLLTFEEARVLGCLLEKEATTPDYYPMTLNGLTAACNQKSNRSPVVEFDESTVEEALHGLRRKRLGAMISMAGSRVPKYKHTITEVLNSLNDGTKALLCELLVRGRQTLGELRTNSDRMHSFPDLAATESALQELLDYPTGAIVTCLPPGGGRKAKTYAHLLCGAVDAEAPAATAAALPSTPPPPDWKREMEEKFAALTKRVEQLESVLRELQG